MTRSEKEPLKCSKNETLHRLPPVRHYIPKYPFYYTSSELFDTQSKTRIVCEEQTKKFVKGNIASGDGGGRAITAQNQHIIGPSDSSIHPAAVSWVTTAIPGARTLEQYDLYRRDALNAKNTVLYPIQAGLLPKYMGYVPGYKFRYGSTFGNLTFNAKEIGVERSATWGGAVSLL